MNRMNWVEHHVSHFRSINEANADHSYIRDKESKNLLPSIANLNRASRHETSTNPYLNGSCLRDINSNFVTATTLVGQYQHNPVANYLNFQPIGGNSHLYYSNNSYFSHETQYNFPPPSCPTAIHSRSWTDVCSNNYPESPLSQLAANTESTQSSPYKSSLVKDEKYIQRREKNNIAAKKCRDNKKQKSNELCYLVVSYEKENDELRRQIDSIRIAIAELKHQLF